MSITKIILLTLLVNLFACEAFNHEGGKRTTAAWTFLRLRSSNTQQCYYVDDAFHKLHGYWYYVLRTINTQTSQIYCGYLSVDKTSKLGFESHLGYLNGSESVEIPITGTYVNETIIEIPRIEKLLTRTSKQNYPFIAQIGICDNDSILVIEPIHYSGASMVFTRDVPESLTGLKIRFGTYDEQNGKERTVRVPVACNTPTQ